MNPLIFPQLRLNQREPKIPGCFYLGEECLMSCLEFRLLDYWFMARDYNDPLNYSMDPKSPLAQVAMSFKRDNMPLIGFGPELLLYLPKTTQVGRLWAHGHGSRRIVTNLLRGDLVIGATGWLTSTKAQWREHSYFLYNFQGLKGH